MHRYFVFFFLTVVLWLTPTRCSQSEGAPGSENAEVKKAALDRFCVTVWPKTTRVISDVDRNKVDFYILLRVVNATEASQTFRMRSNYCDNWIIKGNKDSERIKYSWVSLKNDTKTIKLEPGEAWEKPLLMEIWDGDRLPILLSFKMGFSPSDEDKTYWSNRVVLGIKPGKAKKEKQEEKRKKRAGTCS